MNEYMTKYNLSFDNFSKLQKFSAVYGNLSSFLSVKITSR